MSNKRPVIGALRKIPRKVTALYGGALVAVMLLVWALSQQGNWYERDAANRSRHYARDSEGQIADRCSLLPAVDQPKCVDEAVQAARSNQREEQDLAAQKVTAWWTRAMGVAAILGMALSAIGVFLVYITFRSSSAANATARREYARARIEGRKAGKASEEALATARTSAATAGQQVRIAQDTAYRELRAYVSFENVEIEGVTNQTVAGRICIKNAGKTPAAVEIFLTQVVADWPIAAMPSDAPPAPRYEFHTPFLNASSSEQVDWFFPIPLNAKQTALGERQIAELIANPIKKILLLYGRLEFVDFMRRKRVLNFAYRNHGAIKNGGQCGMIACSFGNKYEDRGQDA